MTGGRVDAPRLAWHRLGYQHTAAMLSAMKEIFSPATANLARAAIRGVLAECWRLGLMTADDYKRAADLPTVRGKREPKGRALELAELRAVLQVCREDVQAWWTHRSAAGARDGAILAIAYGCGLRRSELVNLDLEDYDPNDDSLLIHGKGDKERRVYLPAGASQALKDWIAKRGCVPGPMFYPIRKGDYPIRRRLNSSNALLTICRKRAKQAGVAPFSIHDLRRSYITHLFEQGADPSTIAELVGHSSLNTTRIYDRRGEETKRKTVNLVHVPYGN